MEKIKNIFKNNKKNIFIFIGIIVVIVACVIVFGKGKTRPVDNAGLVNTEESVAEDTNTQKTTESGKKASVSKTESISYAEALVKYKDSRIQLGSGDICPATPNNITYKNGTTVMLDNRSAQSRSITIGNIYSVEPYGFVLVKLASNKTPETFLVDCNNQQNVATILIQD